VRQSTARTARSSWTRQSRWTLRLCDHRQARGLAGAALRIGDAVAGVGAGAQARLARLPRMTCSDGMREKRARVARSVPREGLLSPALAPFAFEPGQLLGDCYFWPTHRPIRPSSTLQKRCEQSRELRSRCVVMERHVGMLSASHYGTLSNCPPRLD
jgi:hypothetical protein